MKPLVGTLLGLVVGLSASGCTSSSTIRDISSPTIDNTSLIENMVEAEFDRVGISYSSDDVRLVRSEVQYRLALNSQGDPPRMVHEEIQRRYGGRITEHQLDHGQISGWLLDRAKQCLLYSGYTQGWEKDPQTCLKNRLDSANISYRTGTVDRVLRAAQEALRRNAGEMSQVLNQMDAIERSAARNAPPSDPYLDGYLFESGRQASSPWPLYQAPPSNPFQPPPSMTCMQYGGMLNCTGSNPLQSSPSMTCMQYGTLGKGGQLNCR